MIETSPEPALFDLPPADDLRLQGYRWEPLEPAKATLVIVHGLGEHGRRYGRVAAALTSAGYRVLAYDQRGHGERAVLAGDFSPQGWQGMLDDLQRLLARHGQAPLFLLGHSMGSMLVHHFMTRYSENLSGVILSGSPGFAPQLQIWGLLAVARLETWRRGRHGHSRRIQQLLLGAASRSFESGNRQDTTGFEWLSRDGEEVRKYVEDPLCGFTPTCGSTLEWFRQYRHAQQPDAVAAIRQDLPLYLFSGSDDPVHGGQKNLDRQIAAYQKAGLRPAWKIYPGGRHEMFNEVNRDQVVADVTSWLDKTLTQHGM